MAELKGLAWLEHHLETFVAPYLGDVPVPKNHYDGYNHLNLYQTRYRKKLWDCWQDAKVAAGNLPILLAGRDVYLFEVMARVEGIATTFRYEISGQVAKSGLITEDYSKCYLIDSGYHGSVPKALKVEKWNLVSGTNALNSARYGEMASFLEGCPKYWTPGTIHNPHPVPSTAFFGPTGEPKLLLPNLSSPEMFRRAAELTILVVRATLEFGGSV